MLHLDLAEKEAFKHFILQRRQNQGNRRVMWFHLGQGRLGCGMLLDPSCCLLPLWGAGDRLGVLDQGPGMGGGIWAYTSGNVGSVGTGRKEEKLRSLMISAIMARSHCYPSLETLQQ